MHCAQKIAPCIFQKRSQCVQRLEPFERHPQVSCVCGGGQLREQINYCFRVKTCILKTLNGTVEIPFVEEVLAKPLKKLNLFKD